MNGRVNKSIPLSAPTANLPTGINQERLENRFWAKVNKDGPLWNGTPCWPWLGKPDYLGYGRFWSKICIKAHRFAYELLIGPIPKGLEIDHLCRNRACVNPYHMEPVTHHENILRGETGQNFATKTYCPRGHPYDKGNTLVYKGSRFCRECKKYIYRKTKGRKAISL